MKPPPFSAFFSRALLRRAGLVAAVSLVLALALVGYLFGAADDFLGRVFSAFFVFFWLLSITFLGVVPLVSWVAVKWFGKSRPEPLTTAGRKPQPPPASATVRKPTRTVTRSEKTS